MYGYVRACECVCAHPIRSDVRSMEEIEAATLLGGSSSSSQAHTFTRRDYVTDTREKSAFAHRAFHAQAGDLRTLPPKTSRLI